MKRFIYFLFIIGISTSAQAQNSGYMGKKLFVDASLRLDPYIDIRADQFGLGYDLSIGRTVSDRTALAINYSIVNRTDYSSTYMGLDVHLYRSSYIAPVGKMWLIGVGVIGFDEKTTYVRSGGIEEITFSKGESYFIKVGHEYRTILKGSDFYFITQFALHYVINAGNEYSEILLSGSNYGGKLGFGIML